jgi:acyl-CoA synthetase (NDP forming)/GNAT superfamily N-acetyltransferase
MSAREVAQHVDVALRDGSTVRVRPVRPEDLDGLRELLGAMSDTSRWLRFLSAGVNLERAARSAAEPRDGIGLVVTAGSPEQIVAHAEFARETGDRAEVAFEVADAWHGRGIATILLAHLAGAAERQGIATFVAYVHPSNHRMVGVFRESGFPVVVKAEAGELFVELPASLGAAARARFEARSRTAAVAAVGHVLRPASVALVGDPGQPAARTVLENVRSGGYTGDLHVVADDGAIPSSVELAIVAVPAPEVLAVARRCVAAGVRAIAVLADGFADAGAAGRGRLAELLAVCRGGGMRMVGPNCLGVVNTDAEVRLAAAATTFLPRPGRMALASQSSAIGIAAIAEADRRGLGLSTFVATGDKADLSGNDFLQFWQDDPATDVILLYLESFGNPRRFAPIARRAGTEKPIVAVKTGRAAVASGPDATAVRRLLSASDVNVDALFAHAGVIRTETIAEQLDVGALLASQPLPAGDRVAIVTNGRGPALACGEACITGGLRVEPPGAALAGALSARLPDAAEPDNPFDLRAHATAGDYATAIEVLAAHEAVDAIAAIFVPPLGTSAQDVAAALRRSAAAAGVPVVGVFPAQGEAELRELAGEHEVPLYGAAVVAARALARMAAYARWRRRPPSSPAPPDGIDADAAAAVIARALTRGDGALDGDEVEELLRAYGLPLAATAQGPGVEMVAGVLSDPDFGPVIACGAAGHAIELLGDATVRLAPVDAAEATAMLRELRAFPLLDGYRGAPKMDFAALADVLVRLSVLAATHAEVEELDCDPVVVTPAGAAVTGARVRVRSPSAARPFPALDR